MEDPARFQRNINVHDPRDQQAEEDADMAADMFPDPEDPKNVDPRNIF